MLLIYKKEKDTAIINVVQCETTSFG